MYHISRLETDSPRGRLEIFNAFAENATGASAHRNALMSSCLFCLQCQKLCPAGVEYDLFFFQVMDFVHRYGIPIGNQSLPRAEICPSSASSFYMRHWRAQERKKPSNIWEKVVIFSGCASGIDEINGIQKALENADVAAAEVLEGICCGLPWLIQGDRKKGFDAMKKVLKILKRIRIKALFTPCPFCLVMFSMYYPLLLGESIELEFRAIGDLFASQRFESPCLLSKKIAYHSPCLMNNTVAAKHRRIIEASAGRSYIRIPPQLCCGHGFGPLPGISQRICQENIGRIKERGVQVLVTDCISCTSFWQEGVREGKWDLEVIPFWKWMADQKRENP